MPLRKNVSGAAALERGQVFFERRARRIRDAGVFVTLVLADLLLRVGRSEIDRHIDGAGGRVGLLTGVNGARRKPAADCS